jgi:hypothetical protein
VAPSPPAHRNKSLEIRFFGPTFSTRRRICIYIRNEFLLIIRMRGIAHVFVCVCVCLCLLVCVYVCVCVCAYVSDGPIDALTACIFENWINFRCVQLESSCRKNSDFNLDAAVLKVLRIHCLRFVLAPPARM